VRNRGDGAPPVQIFAVDNMLRLGPQTQAGTSIDPLGVMSASAAAHNFARPVTFQLPAAIAGAKHLQAHTPYL